MSLEQVCDFCDKDQAEIFCCNCKIYICEKCLGKHLKINQADTHVLRKIQSELQDDIVSKIFCEEHPQKEIEFYCAKDDKLICYMCIIHGPHQDHGAMILSEYIQDLKINELRIQMEYNINDQLFKQDEQLDLIQQTKVEFLKYIESQKEITKEIKSQTEKLVIEMDKLNRDFDSFKNQSNTASQLTIIKVHKNLCDLKNQFNQIKDNQKQDVNLKQFRQLWHCSQVEQQQQIVSQEQKIKIVEIDDQINQQSSKILEQFRIEKPYDQLYNQPQKLQQPQLKVEKDKKIFQGISPQRNFQKQLAFHSYDASQVQVTMNGTSIRKINEWSIQSTFLNFVQDERKIYKFRFCIEQMGANSNIVIGLSLNEFKPLRNMFLGTTLNSFGFQTNSGLISHNNNSYKYGESIRTGQFVTLVINLINKSISFEKNDQNLGKIAFIDVPFGNYIYIGVSLYSIGDTVSICDVNLTK